MSRIVITPPGRFSLPRFAELWEGRDVFKRFGLRDITLRYRQTALGVAWVIIQPLLAAGVFTIVFGQVADLPSDGLPYFLFSFAGMLIWIAFSGVVGRASSSLVANQALVSKVFFPRMLVPLAVVLSVLLDVAVAAALYVVMLLVYQVNPGWPILLAPVWMGATLLFAMGIGLACSALMVKYRDVQYVVPFLLQMFLYASPVAYSLAAVPANLLPWYNLNPLSWILQTFRWSVLGAEAPPTWQIIGSLVVPVIVFMAGALFFQQFERDFADVI